MAFVIALAVLQVAKPGSYLHVVCHMFSENMLPNGTVNQQVLSVHFYSMQQICVMQGLLFIEATTLQSLNRELRALSHAHHITSHHITSH